MNNKKQAVLLKNILVVTFLTTLFVGCGVSNGIGLGHQEVKSYFHKGVVVSSNRVLVDKAKLSFVKGMGVGAGLGTVIGGVQGTVIGGTAGGLGGVTAGYVRDGNEQEAYELIIRKGLEEFKAYTKDNFLAGTELEFVVRNDGSLTNLKLVNQLNKVYSYEDVDFEE